MARRKSSAILLLLLSLTTVVFQSSLLQVPLVHALTWSTPTPLTPFGSLDDKPYVIQDSQKNLFLTYESSRSGNWDIYLRELMAGTWLPEQRLTTSNATDLSPSLAQLSNGNLLLAWTSARGSSNYAIWTKLYSGGNWSPDAQLTFPGSSSRDSSPTLLQLNNGTLWLFWSRETVSGTTLIRDLYYRSYGNGIWSGDQQFSTLGTEEQPNLLQTDYGTIWLTYAANRAGNLDVYSKIFNGVSWSAEKPLTSNTADDSQPWLMQDYNGLLYLYWTRCVPTNGQNCEDDIFYKTSSDLGLTWSAEVQFTIDPTGFTINDSHASAIHAYDKSIYVFWGTDLTGPGADYDVYVTTSNPIPLHDVAVSNAFTSTTSLQEGGIVKVNATAKNLGDYNETLFLNAYYRNASGVIFKSTTTSLVPGKSASVQFAWNTSKRAPVSYSVYITVQPVPGESPRRQTDNTASAGNVTVLPVDPDINMDGKVDIVDASIVAFRFGEKIGPADINGDCRVDILDAAILALAFGTQPGDPRWNPMADLNGDGKVSILDASILGFVFGKKTGREDINHDCKVDILDASLIGFWFGWGT